MAITYAVVLRFLNGWIRPIAAVRERTPKTVPQAAVQAPECAVQDSFKHWTAARWRIDYPIRIRQEE